MYDINGKLEDERSGSGSEGSQACGKQHRSTIVIRIKMSVSIHVRIIMSCIIVMYTLLPPPQASGSGSAAGSGSGSGSGSQGKRLHTRSHKSLYIQGEIPLGNATNKCEIPLATQLNYTILYYTILYYHILSYLLPLGSGSEGSVELHNAGRRRRPAAEGARVLLLLLLLLL